MKRIYYILLCIPLILSGCSKDEDDPGIEPEEDTYLFTSHRFYLDEEDGIEKSVINKDRMTISNYTSTEARGTSTAWDLVTDLSRFYDDSWTPLELHIADGHTIPLPEDIFDGQIITGSRKGLFMLNGSELFPHEESLSDEVAVAPYTRVIITDHYDRTVILLSYTAVFVGEQTGEELTITGKWEGTFYEWKGMSLEQQPLTSGQ